MTPKLLDIPFKGGRNYLQGPDLFLAAFETISAKEGAAVNNFEIGFHRMTKNVADVVIGGDEKPENAFATGVYENVTGKVRFWLVETEIEVTIRVPYSEEELVAGIEFSDDGVSAVLAEGVGFSNIETWVSMIKALHQKTFVGADGKWVFARAKMIDYFPDHAPAEYRVQLAAKLGHKLTRNEVFLDDHKVGDVFFSLM